jgi:hypothetical protein
MLPAEHRLWTVKKKNTHEVALGRRGVKARNENMSPKERSTVARAAANARWEQWGKDRKKKQ